MSAESIRDRLLKLNDVVKINLRGGYIVGER